MKNHYVLVTTLSALLFASSGYGAARDKDNDGLPDKWEKTHNLSTKRNDAQKDPDLDKLTNINEYRYHSDPHDNDSDDDQLRDGREIYTTHTSPTRRDSDRDGISDGLEDNDHDGIDNRHDGHDDGADHDADDDNGSDDSDNHDVGDDHGDHGENHQ